MRKRIYSALLAATLALSLCGVAVAAEPEITAPSCLLAEADGSLVLVDSFRHALWRRDGRGVFTRLAGREGTPDVSGMPTGGYNDGAAGQAAFQSPWAAAPFGGGYVISDTGNHVLRLLADGKVGTLAGTGKAGYQNDSGTKAAFDTPTGLSVGPDGSLYIADTGNHAIRVMDTRGNVTTLLGGKDGCADGNLTDARLYEPTALCWSDGVLYIADSGNNRICKLENGTLTTLAGGGPDGDGYVDGDAVRARFSHPQGLAVSEGTVYVADTGNGAVRAISGGQVSTLMGLGQGAGGLYPISPRGLALSGDLLYVGDVFSRLLFSVALPAEHPTFTDVPDSAWYAGAVFNMTRRGVLSPTGDGLFSPGAPLTQGIVLRGKSDLVPQRTLTRAELLTFLYRYHTELGGTAADGDLAAFSDSAAVPAWAAQAMGWGVSTGLIHGQPGSLLAPLSPVTRAEAAVILQRYLAL